MAANPAMTPGETMPRLSACGVRVARVPVSPLTAALCRSATAVRNLTVDMVEAGNRVSLRLHLLRTREVDATPGQRTRQPVVARAALLAARAAAALWPWRRDRPPGSPPVLPVPRIRNLESP